MAGANSPITVVTEKKILQMLKCFEYLVLSPSLCMLVQLFSSIAMNSGY